MTTFPSFSLCLTVAMVMPLVHSFTSSSVSWNRPRVSPLLVSVEAVETLQALPPVETYEYASTNLLSQIDAFWKACPYTAAALVCGFKASAADAIAQQSTATEKEVTEEKYYMTSTSAAAAAVLPSTPLLQSVLEELDLKRNLAFVLYGALYQGMVHEYVFNTLYPAWFGTGTEVSVVLVKVLFNLLVQTTFVTLPVAYILKSLIHTTKEQFSGNPLEAAMDKYWQDIQHQQLLLKCFALWGPVQCLTFSVVPEHLRVTFIAIVSFFWLILLSQISNANNDVVAAIPVKQS